VKTHAIVLTLERFQERRSQERRRGSGEKERFRREGENEV